MKNVYNMWLNKEQVTRPSVHPVPWVCVYLKYWVKMLTAVLIGDRTMGNFFPPLKNSSIFTMSMYYFYKEKINVYVLKLSTQNKVTFSKCGKYCLSSSAFPFFTHLKYSLPAQCPSSQHFNLLSCILCSHKPMSL